MTKISSWAGRNRDAAAGDPSGLLEGPEIQQGATAFAVAPDIFLRHEGRLKQARELIKGRVDPIRDMTVSLALETIEQEEIEGDMAELGVYRGEMAFLYHKILPSKSCIFLTRLSASRRETWRHRRILASTIPASNMSDCELAMMQMSYLNQGISPKRFLVSRNAVSVL
jgi:hypothetical protein